MLFGARQQQKTEAKKEKAAAKKEAQRKRQRAKQVSCDQFWHAAQRGQIDTIKAFLRNADHLLGSLGSHRRTHALYKSLHIAVKNCHEVTVCALLAAGARPSLDAVCAAASTDNVSVLQRLVDAHGSVNYEGITHCENCAASKIPLKIAASAKSSACVARLITLKANVQTHGYAASPLVRMLCGRGTTRRTYIEPAWSRKSTLSAVRCLLDAKLDPHRGSLLDSVDARRSDVAGLLLDANAHVDSVALTACARKSLPRLFRRMWARLIPVGNDGEGGKEDDTAFEQHCALTYACLRNDSCTVAQLIAAGTRFMPEHAAGILRHAARCSHLRELRLLVQAKADVAMLSGTSW